MQTRDWYKKGNELINEIDGTVLNKGLVAFWSIGQGGFIFKINGITICIDPVLNDLFDVNGNTRRNFKPPFEPSCIKNWDYIICTHNHADHLNLNTLVPISKSSPNTIFIVPAPHTSVLVSSGIDSGRVVSAKENSTIKLKNNVTVTPVAASHEEYFTDANGDFISLGYLINSDGITIYHSGDTVLTDKLVKTISEIKYINIAFLPINGADWERRFRDVIGNMNARDAAYFADIINADMVVPFHFDMVMRNGESPVIFAQYMHDMYPCNKYHIMMLGERFIYMK